MKRLSINQIKKISLSCIISFIISFSLIQAKDTVVAEEESFTFSDPVAIHEDKIYSKEDFMAFVVAVFGQEIETVESKERAEDFVEAYFIQRSIQEYAVSNGYEKNPRYIQALKAAKYRVLFELVTESFLENVEIAEPAIELKYEAYLESEDVQEYQISYILSQDEEAMKLFINDYNNQNLTFLELSNIYKDRYPDNYDVSIYDGWFGRSNINIDFLNVIKEMDRGAVSSVPHNIYGAYYVFFLKDKRTGNPASLEELRERFELEIRDELLEEYIQGFKVMDWKLNM